jgi:hypothetical protein
VGYIINPYSYATGGAFENEYSLAFDGVDDNVIVPYNSTLDVVTAAHSLSFWMKTSLVRIMCVMEKGRGDELAAFIINSKIYWGGANGYYGGTVNVQDGNWHHVVLVATGTVAGSTIYIDGSAVATGNVKVQASANTDDFTIGMDADGNNEYTGNLDEIAIFNYALSASDVTSMYNSGVPNNLDDLSTPPVAWWRMGDNGSWKSPQWLLPENSNKDKYSNFSFSLDGIDDYINCGANSSLQPTTGITLSTWFMIPAGSLHYSADTLISQDHIPYGGLYNGYYMEVTIASNGYLYSKFALGDGTAETTVTKNTSSVGTPPYVADTWYHLCGTWDGSNMTLYINGVFLGTTAFSGPITYDASEETFIGKRGHNQSDNFVGSIDEVSVFNVGKNATEVAAIYNNGVPTDLTGETGLVGWWRMGEDATFVYNVNPEGTWTVPDQVGSNDGTSNNTFLDTGRVGDAPNSNSNALSYNMDEADREEETP